MVEPYCYSTPLTPEDGERMGHLLGLVIATCAKACAAKTGFPVEFFMASFTRESALDALQLEFLSRIDRGDPEAEAAGGAGGWLLKTTNRAMRRTLLIAEIHGR
ncbi:hypothetical protein [Streptomyces sp. NPDC048442]|uniref:hypothetical protein n=1 Tax=Streptomyces sp. NPDC048442 TaxID=3154823 RepID=UPI00343E0B5D